MFQMVLNVQVIHHMQQTKQFLRQEESDFQKHLTDRSS